MKIRNLKIKLIAPVLLLIPMSCMHLGDGHHSGDHHSSNYQPSYQYLIHDLPPEVVLGVEGTPIPQDDKERG